MKLIIGYINPFKLDDVVEAVKEAGVSGLTSVEAQGFGRQGGHTETYRGAEYEVDFLTKTKIEIIVSEAMVNSVIETIEKTAKTGKIGDGKIFVYDVSQAIRIRTGQTVNDSI